MKCPYSLEDTIRVWQSASISIVWAPLNVRAKICRHFYKPGRFLSSTFGGIKCSKTHLPVILVLQCEDSGDQSCFLSNCQPSFTCLEETYLLKLWPKENNVSWQKDGLRLKWASRLVVEKLEGWGIGEESFGFFFHCRMKNLALFCRVVKVEMECWSQKNEVDWG